MVYFDYYIEFPLQLGTIAPLSFLFIGFVFLVFLFSRSFQGILRPYILLFASSLFLYSYAQYHFISLILLSIYTYIMGFLISSKKKIWLMIAICPYILLFLFYKYGNQLLIPLGYSFVSFKAISYLCDVFSGKIKNEKNILYFVNYILFFPTVTAGPIHRYPAFQKVISSRQEFNYMDAKNGAFEMFLGIFEKMVFCDFIASIASRLSSVEVTGWGAILGIVLYSFRIYLDFDSYSHISIGCARLLGFQLKRNFASPYLSTSIAEFWRRWHISLGAFFRDYVYIPLGGSRKGTLRKYACIMVVFLLSGIWHGSTVNFAVWGLAHGLLRIIQDQIPLFKKEVHPVLKPFLIAVNFVIVTVLWQLFLYGNFGDVVAVFQRVMVFETSISSLEITKNEWIWMTVILLSTVIYDIWHDKRDALSDYASLWLPLRWLGYAALIFIFLIFGVYGGSVSAADFIYKFF